MSGRFVPVDRNTAYLLPPSVQEWLPENHLARFVVEIVEQLDLAKLTAAWSRRSETDPPAGVKLTHPGLVIASPARRVLDPVHGGYLAYFRP